MSTAAHYPHLTLATSDGNGSSPRIGKTRYKVLHLASEHYHHGWTAEELLRQHPDLRPEEVYAALTYFYDHYEQLVGQLVSQMNASSEAEQPSPRQNAISRAELLQRKSSGGA